MSKDINRPWRYIVPNSDPANLTPEEQEELKGLTQSDLDSLRNFFAENDISKGNMTVTVARGTMDGWPIENYKGVVVSRFDLEGELHVMTADGHVVNVDKLMNELRGHLPPKA